MVIVELHKHKAVALRDDGRFVALRQQGYQVGQRLEAADAATARRRLPRLAAACLAAVLLLGGSAVTAAYLPYSYVTLDVNPSIQYTLNAFDRVLSVRAVDEDAQTVVNALEKEEVVSQSIDQAIEMTVEQCRREGYLYRDAQDYMVLSVASRADGKKARLFHRLGGSSFGDGLISTEVVPTTIRELEEARQEGTTPGKLAIITRMQKQTGDTQGAQKWVHTPVRDILLAAAPEDEETVDRDTAGQDSSPRGENPKSVSPAEKPASGPRSTGPRSSLGSKSQEHDRSGRIAGGGAAAKN